MRSEKDYARSSAKLWNCIDGSNPFRLRKNKSKAIARRLARRKEKETLMREILEMLAARENESA